MLGRLLTKLKREDSNPTVTGTGTGSPTATTTSSPKPSTTSTPSKPVLSTETTPTSPDTSASTSTSTTSAPSTPQSTSTSTTTAPASSPPSSKPSFFQRASSLLQSKSRTSTPSASTPSSATASTSTSPSEKEELDTPTSSSLPPVAPKSGSKTSSATKSPARAPLHRDVSLILSDLITLTETLFNHQKPIQREVEHVTSQFEIWTSRDVVMELPRVMHAAHMMKVEFPTSQTTAEPHLVKANQSLSDALTLCRATLTQADEMETGRSTSHAASDARLAVTRASIVTSMKQDTEEIERQHEQELTTLLAKYKRRKKGTVQPQSTTSEGGKTDTTAVTTAVTTAATTPATTTTTSTTTTDASSATSTPSTSETTPTPAATTTGNETPSTQ